MPCATGSTSSLPTAVVRGSEKRGLTQLDGNCVLGSLVQSMVVEKSIETPARRARPGDAAAGCSQVVLLYVECTVSKTRWLLLAGPHQPCIRAPDTRARVSLTLVDNAKDDICDS
jgi:hypothetical protein